MRSLLTSGLGARWVALAAGVFLGACDIENFDTLGSLDRLPAGSEERIRLFAPIDTVLGDEIVPVRVERLAHEDDLPTEPGRARCLVVRVAGPARFVDFARSGDALVTVSELEIMLDRGQSQMIGVVGTDFGSALVWARLVDAACPEPAGAVALAEASRTLRFDSGTTLPIDVDAGF
jgi:hypothetical protein